MAKRKSKVGAVSCPPLSLHFRNVEEVIKYISEGVNDTTLVGHKVHASKFLDNSLGSFNECSGIAEYRELMRSGVDCEALAGSPSGFDGSSMLLAPSVSGSFGDVVAYLQGVPECMEDFTEVETNNFLPIVLDCSVCVKMKGGELSRRFKAFFECVNTLELGNTRVSIKIAFRCQIQDKFIEVDMMVKDFHEPLINTLHSTLLGHPATFRGLFFALLSLHSTMGTLAYVQSLDFSKIEGKKISFQEMSASEIKQNLLS